MSISGKVVLITGGAKNLGAEIARSLASLGADLALHYNSASTKDSADKLSAEISKSFPQGKVRFYSGDLTTERGVEALFANVLKDFSKIDVVVNTVGKVLKKPLSEITEQEYDEMFAINSKAAFFILKYGAKHVSDGGQLITIVTSLLGAYTGLYTSYAGSKAPVEHFTRGLSKELMPRGVSVNCIAPGPMDTPFFYAQESPETVAYHKSNAIGGRLTDIKDIAPIVKSLVTDGNWVNGQTLFVNGGYVTR